MKHQDLADSPEPLSLVELADRLGALGPFPFRVTRVMLLAKVVAMVRGESARGVFPRLIF